MTNKDVYNDIGIVNIVKNHSSCHFSKIIRKSRTGVEKEELIPTFIIRVPEEKARILATTIADLGLRTKLYHRSQILGKDGYIRNGYSFISIRDTGQLKNVILPLLLKLSPGNDHVQKWLEKIGSDRSVPERYRIIYNLYKSGFHDKKPD